MLFKKVESRVKPDEVEEISNQRYLIRKNIKEVVKKDEKDGNIKIWVYDEAVANEAEYAAYSALLVVESKRESDVIDEYTLKLIEEGII